VLVLIFVKLVCGALMRNGFGLWLVTSITYFEYVSYYNFNFI